MVATVNEMNPRQDGRRPVRRLRQRATAGRRGREIREGSIFLTNDPYLCDGTIDHTGSCSCQSLMEQLKSRYEVDFSYCMPYLPLSGRFDWRIVLPGRNARIGRVARTHTQLLSGRWPVSVRRIRPSIPLAAGTAFRRRDPSTSRHLSAQPASGRSPPGPAPTASGRTGTMRSHDQTSLAPVGTRPVSENRQRAMSSLRTSATIVTRRIRRRVPAVRFSNHIESALSG